MERALVVMAIAMSIQTLLFVGAAIGAFMAWRRASLALEEAKIQMNAQIAHLRAHVDRISGTVEEVAGSVRRGTSAVGDVVSDVRDVMGTVGNGLHSVASVVTAPRAAVALGVWRGLAMWRKRRASHRAEAALASQIQ
jgi:hypothetical protein